MPNYVPGVGPISGAKLMIIGEAPGRFEDEYRRPFVGPTGDLLDDLLEAAGIQRDECYITNVVKYQPPNNDWKRLSEIGVSLPEQQSKLLQEIRHIQPNCILALGDKALQATTGKSGINNYRGSILPCRDGVSKVVSTFHPSNLLYQKGRGVKGKGLFKYSWKYVMIADMKRAKEQSMFQALSTPERVLSVCRDSLQLYRFLKRHEHLDKSSIDIESMNCLPVCVGIAFNKYEAISVPLYSKFSGVKISDTSIQDTAERWRLLAKFLSETKIIGQNFKYDEEKLYRLGLRCGDLFADTLSMEHTLNPELPSKKLFVLSSIRTEEPYYKDEGSEFNAAKDSIDQLLLYNGKDAAVTYEVWQDQDNELTEFESISPKIRDFYYNYVVKLHKFYLEMERTGMQIDEEVRAQLNKKYNAWHNRLQDKFVELIGKKVNVNSYKKLAHIMYDEMHFPYRGNTGEDTIVQLIDNAVHDDKRVAFGNTVLDDRRVRKSKSSYINVKPDYDGRVRTSYYITGTETGRSTTQKFKKPVRPEPMCWSGHTITKHGEIGGDIRTMLVPDNGYVFLAMDKSQAEARVVAVLCEDWELLNAFGKIDIHRRTAGLVFDLVNSIELQPICSNPEVDAIGKDSGERFVGKKTRHSGNYDIGAETFHRDASSEARKFGIKIDFSEWKAGQALDKFHEASPKIRGVFHRDIKFHIETTRTLVNPFGRVRRFLDRMDHKIFREAYAFIPQSTVHDDITSGGMKAKDRLQGIRFVKEDHDSFTLLAPVNEVEKVAKVMKEECEKEIDFMQCTIKRDIKLIIPVDFEVGEKNYRDMVKLKI